jgi:hypothetical protein
MSRNDNGDVPPQYAMTGRAGDVTAAAIAQAATHLLAQSKQPTVAAAAQTTGSAGCLSRWWSGVRPVRALQGRRWQVGPGRWVGRCSVA